MNELDANHAEEEAWLLISDVQRQRRWQLF